MSKFQIVTFKPGPTLGALERKKREKYSFSHDYSSMKANDGLRLSSCRLHSQTMVNLHWSLNQFRHKLKLSVQWRNDQHGCARLVVNFCSPRVQFFFSISSFSWFLFLSLCDRVWTCECSVNCECEPIVGLEEISAKRNVFIERMSLQETVSVFPQRCDPHLILQNH